MYFQCVEHNRNCDTACFMQVLQNVWCTGRLTMRKYIIRTFYGCKLYGVKRNRPLHRNVQQVQAALLPAQQLMQQPVQQPAQQVCTLSFVNRKWHTLSPHLWRSIDIQEIMCLLPFAIKSMAAGSVQIYISLQECMCIIVDMYIFSCNWEMGRNK